MTVVKADADGAGRGRVARRFGLPESSAGRRPIILAIVFDTLGVGLLFPISLLYFTVTTDIPVARLGALVSAAAFLSLPAGLLGGELVQRFGAKRVMVANNICSALGYLGYCFATGPATVFAASFLVAVADRLFWSSYPPFLRGVAAGSSVGTWFAFLESIKAACMAAGAGLSALLLATDGERGLRLLVVVNIATCLVSAVLIGAVRMASPVVPPEPARHGGWAAVLRDPRHLLLGAGQLLITPMGLLGMTVFPLFFTQNWRLGTWIGPLLFTAGCLLTFLLQSPVTARLSHLPQGRLIVAATLLCCAAMGLLALFSAVFPAASAAPPAPVAVLITSATTVLIGLGGVLFLPAGNAVLMSVATEHNAGRVSAVFHTGTSLAMCATPALTSGLLGHPVGLWLTMAAMSVVGCACFLLVTNGLHRPGPAGPR